MSKLLILDDDSGIRHLCYDLFTEEGHEVLTTSRSEQLFPYIKSEKPDLVLIDLNLHEEDGLSILRKMVANRAQPTPAIIFSGVITPEIEKDCYEAGAIEVVKKDGNIDELRIKVKKVLAAKHKIFNEPEKATPKGKILAVDDEKEMRHLLKTFFEGKGYQTFVASSGEDALLIAEKEKPSMVLLDMNMPGMDGLVTLRKLREGNPKVGVVMATGMRDEDMTQEAMRLGAYAYVTKPFDLQYLELVVLNRLVMAS